MAQHVKNVSADKIALAVQKPICSSRARNLLICSVEKISHALLLSGMHELRTGLELCVAGRSPRAKAIILAFSDNDISAPWAKKVNWVPPPLHGRLVQLGGFHKVEMAASLSSAAAAAAAAAVHDANCGHVRCLGETIYLQQLALVYVAKQFATITTGCSC
jgi:hypothetical protein